MAAYPLVRRDRWRLARHAGIRSGMAAEPQARQAGSIRPAERRATIDVCLTASAVLVTGSEWRSTAWLGAAAAAGWCALVALVR